MRAAIAFIALLTSLYCFGVIVYALYTTFGFMPTLATIALPILSAHVITRSAEEA